MNLWFLYSILYRITCENIRVFCLSSVVKLFIYLPFNDSLCTYYKHVTKIFIKYVCLKMENYNNLCLVYLYLKQKSFTRVHAVQISYF